MIRNAFGKTRQARWIALVGLVGVAVGIASAALAMPKPIPPSLREQAGMTVSPVSEDYVDARTVALVFEKRDAVGGRAPVGGTLTRSLCDAGKSVSTGQLVAEIDGVPVVALHTSVPLWRSFDENDAGEDVVSFQEALRVVGSDVIVTGRYDDQTRQAVDSLLSGLASTVKGARWDASSWSWIPADTVPVESCPSALGQKIDEGAELFQSSPTLATAQVEKLPDDLVPGGRVLSIGSTTFSIGTDGLVPEKKLGALTRELRVAGAFGSAEPPPVPATLELEEPIHVLAVPSAAVGVTRGGAACVSDGEDVTEVEVVASRLGSTLLKVPDAVASEVFVPARLSGTACT